MLRSRAEHGVSKHEAGPPPFEAAASQPEGGARAAQGHKMQTLRDPSLTSYYINETFYRQLVEDFTDWQRDELVVADSAERDRFRMLIEREARLLDQLDFDKWLAMYMPECIYWVPGTPGGGDPRREIAMSFDDRRRMEDRI